MTCTVVPAGTVPRSHPRVVQAPLTFVRVSPGPSWSSSRTSASDGPAFVTLIVNGTMVPGVTGPGGAVFVTMRSAAGITVAVAPATLFAGSGSGVNDELTLATLEIDVAVDVADVAMTTVTVTVVPLARLPKLHDTTPPASLHVPCVAVAETNEISGGSVSVRVTSTDVFGPVSVTTSVDVRSCPGNSGSGLAVFVSVRSASRRWA